MKWRVRMYKGKFNIPYHPNAFCSAMAVAFYTTAEYRRGERDNIAKLKFWTPILYIPFQVG